MIYCNREAQQSGLDYMRTSWRDKNLGINCNSAVALTVQSFKSNTTTPAMWRNGLLYLVGGIPAEASSITGHWMTECGLSRRACCCVCMHSETRSLCAIADSGQSKTHAKLQSAGMAKTAFFTRSGGFGGIPADHLWGAEHSG